MSDVSLAYVPVGSRARAPAAQARQEDERYVLYDVSFEVDVGQQIAVVGPNGAGKSTLFKVIAGTLEADEGRIEIFGHDPGQHICIAYVPQRSQIDWAFPVTVEDVVMMGRVGQIGLFRRPGQRDRQVVHSSLQRVQAAQLARRQIGELSGGQQQRVFIARALAQQAELLLLDEPFTGLDAPSREALFEILEGLHADGVTLMVATHDLNLAAEQFDRVMLLNRTMVAFGAAEAVLTTRNLQRAYGGHIHVVTNGDGSLLLADTCCEGR
jgi:ABC-type Mn2+/Zn2+ transport system ATPase subunit